MTRSNKTPNNPAKSRIKSLKSVTPQKRTWRKWHNQPALLARQAADERRHDRLFGLFNVTHHVTITRSRFCVTFFVPTSVAANQSINLLSQPVLSTSHHQPVTPTNHQPVTTNLLSHLLSYPSHFAVHPINQHCNQHISRWSLLFILFVILLVMSSRLSPRYRPAIV